LRVAGYRHLRRNFALFLFDYVAFGVAFSLISSGGTVVPSFVSQLTDSKQLIGLAGSLYMVCWLLPQLFFAQIINRTVRRQPYMIISPVGRLLMILVAMLISWLGIDNPGLSLAVFFAGYWLMAATDAPVTVVWGDMLGSTIPSNLRGVLFGIGQFFVAIGALAMREFTRWVLGDSGLAFPHNYALLFGVAGVVIFLGGIGLSLTIEEKHGTPPALGPRVREYVPYLGNVLRTDREFRKFVRTRLLFDLALMSLPFLAVFGVGVLGLKTENVVADSILLIEIGSVFASLLMAWFSHRSGSRAVILISGVFLLLQSGLLLACFVGGGQTALYLAFVMVGARAASMTPSYFDWMITHAPPDRRPIYIGLTNTISALSNLAPVLGGTLLQWTATPVFADASRLFPPFLGIRSAEFTNYALLFGASVVLALAGLYSALRLSEPRHALATAQREISEVETSPA
jgi:MFS family permease